MKSSILNLSHSVKQTGKMGQLMPIACFDVVPGDKINHQIKALLRTQPLLAPLMHLVDIDIHAYYSPDRLAWEDSEDFHSGGDDGLEAPVAPYMNFPAEGYPSGSLADYLGLPVAGPVDPDNPEGPQLDFTGLKHSALPFRHYNLIFNNHYRDSQIVPEEVVSLASGLDTTTNKDLLYPAWKRDYFTQARPEAQLGPDVIIPLQGQAPVYSQFDMNNNNSQVTNNDTVNGGQLWISGQTVGTSALNANLDVAGASIGVRDLRESNATQRHLEFNNVWGGRYIEQLMARFGVRVPDFRLQIPEFLGAGSAKFQFSEVIQTAEGTEPVGSLFGHGISIVGSNRYKYKAVEHGFVMVFMIIRPKTQYFQGIHRMWSRETKFDYLLPEFQDIGDQAILKKEIYATAADPEEIFGYTPMFEDYRTIPSRVAGEFRNVFKYWHMAREFASEPSLNPAFITCNPTDRIWPAGLESGADQLYFNIEHNIQTRRLLRQHPQYLLK